MNRRIVLIVLGVLIILTPYAGMPNGVRSVVIQLLGLLVVLTPFVIARASSKEYVSRARKKEEHHEEEEIDEMVDMG